MTEQHKQELKQITDRIDIALKNLVEQLNKCAEAMRQFVEECGKIKVKKPKPVQW